MRFPICWPFESLHQSLAKFSSRRALIEGGGGICEIRCKNLQGERGRFGRVKAKVIRSPSPLLGEGKLDYAFSLAPGLSYPEESFDEADPSPDSAERSVEKYKTPRKSRGPGPGVLRGPATRNDRRRRRRLPVRRERNSSWTRNE